MSNEHMDITEIERLARGAAKEIEAHFDNIGGDLATALDRIEEIIELCRNNGGGSHGEKKDQT
jgi:hypothetical protein